MLSHKICCTNIFWFDSQVSHILLCQSSKYSCAWHLRPWKQISISINRSSWHKYIYGFSYNFHERIDEKIALKCNIFIHFYSFSHIHNNIYLSWTWTVNLSSNPNRGGITRKQKILLLSAFQTRGICLALVITFYI